VSTYKNKDIIYIRKKSTFPSDVFAQVEMFPLKGEKTSRNQLNERTGSEKKKHLTSFPSTQQTSSLIHLYTVSVQETAMTSLFPDRGQSEDKYLRLTLTYCSGSDLRHFYIWEQ